MELDIPHVPIFIEDVNNFESGTRIVVKKIRPNWDLDRVRFKLFSDGLTNKLIGAFNDSCPEDDGVLVRIYGKNTDQIIDRKAEFENFKFLHRAGYAPTLYATFDNGMAYKYIPGETLTTTTVRDPAVYKLVAKMMAKFHSLKFNGKNDGTTNEPGLWRKMEQFVSLIPERFSSPSTDLRFQKTFVGGIESLKTEIRNLKTLLTNTSCPVVFSHNDLLLTNIIVQCDNEKRPVNVEFIDYEYSMLNYQPFDIANHFNEFSGVQDPDSSLYPNVELQMDWLTVYLKEYLGEPLDHSDQRVIALKNQVDIFAAASHLLWTIWSIAQSELSTIDFDYLGYAELRFEQYVNLKSLIAG